jgi:multisubunit Na+/H+ antiporter MnhF subunit
MIISTQAEEELTLFIPSPRSQIKAKAFNQRLVSLSTVNCSISCRLITTSLVLKEGSSVNQDIFMNIIAFIS